MNFEQELKYIDADLKRLHNDFYLKQNDLMKLAGINRKQAKDKIYLENEKVCNEILVRLVAVSNYLSFKKIETLILVSKIDTLKNKCWALIGLT